MISAIDESFQAAQAALPAPAAVTILLPALTTKLSRSRSFLDAHHVHVNVVHAVACRTAGHEAFVAPVERIEDRHAFRCRPLRVETCGERRLAPRTQGRNVFARKALRIL